MQKVNRRMYSIKKLQLIMVFFFVVPVFSLQVIQNFYCLREIQTEMEQSGKSTIYLYQRQLENDIHRIETSISGYWAQDYSHGRLLYPQNELDVYRYAYDITAEYKTLISSEPIIAAVFFLSDANHILRGAFSTATTTYGERAAMWDYAEDLLNRWEEDFSRTWAPVEMGGRCFLLRSFGSRSARTLCLIDLDQTVKPQDASYFPDDSFLLYADGKGTPLTSRESLQQHGIVLSTRQGDSYIAGKHFVVQTYSDAVGMYMVFLEAYPESLPRMSSFFVLILVSSVLIFTLVPLLFLALKRWYLRPMERMTAVLEKIRSGALNARFEEKQKVEELQQLSTSFNEMMDKMSDLKIEAYEKELQYQYAELQYLQLQISPHFFLNTLKTLYGMAERKKYDKIQNAILMVSDHVRYIFHDNTERVLVETELRHVENYVKMQQYMTSQPIRLELSVHEDVRCARIPALCIQTFVENSCKYAAVPEHELVIRVIVQRLCTEEGVYLDIAVSDNGPGIPAALREEFNGKVFFEHREHHIGILNVRQRLYLLYGNRFDFACLEEEPGATFEMIFPLEEDPPEEDTCAEE